MLIESDKNSRIKNIIKLSEKSRERKSQRLFIVEGKQENKFALEAGFESVEFFLQEDIFNSEFQLLNKPTFQVTFQVYSKIAYRKITEGIIGVYKYPDFNINDVKLKKNPFVLIIESVEKPGNLGAICRTADIFGVDLIAICDEKTDIFNPNVIRSSVGSVFNIPVISVKKEDLSDFLLKNKIPIYATYMNANSIHINNENLKESCGIIFGTEHSGISDFWLDKAKRNILIPMYGKVDSLNVSSAVAITCYEVRRQREDK